ncbi:MAG: DUF1553 domain-containing protein [Planctomycetales bacterium]|nr:DUF1553 domain-containing protein [Planctomycetales bacterium]
MRLQFQRLLATTLLVAATCLPLLADGGADNAATVEFFEARIRPVLVEHCYECHNSAEKAEGNLALDHRGGWLTGGDSGPAIVAGDPEVSPLIRAIRHDEDVSSMPEDADKLPDGVIADFVRWVASGAVDPRDRPPSLDDADRAAAWQVTLAERKQWWSFQPISRPAIPAPRHDGASDHPVDRFIAARLAEIGLTPAPPAERRALARRLYFVLTGLPPSPDEVERFVADSDPDAYERLVDRLLASPAFGECWARHWMDWWRYAESIGAEGDPEVPFAWRYRDYLIDALNADVPFDQLVREHLAGDRLSNPRIDDAGVNVSAIGPAHLRMVQHGYAPTDSVEELIRFTDNQIDVVSKALLGITLSCARCHEHKFDPLSQRDYYAWFGIMESCRPAMITIDAATNDVDIDSELSRAKDAIRAALAEHWRAEVAELPTRLTAADPASESWKARLNAALEAPNDDPLYLWAKAVSTDGDFADVWTSLVDEYHASRQALDRRAASAAPNWHVADVAGDWFRHGSGLAQTSTPAGEFSLPPDGDRVVGGVYPAGVFTQTLSDKHNGVFSSPSFTVDMPSLWVRVAGGGNARVRYVMDHYPRVTGPIYKAYDLTDGRLTWRKWDLNYWEGDRTHVELATAGDIPIEADPAQTRSWFGITDVVAVREGEQPPRDELAEYARSFFEAAAAVPPDSADALAELYGEVLGRAITHWRDGVASDDEARLLDMLIRSELLANRRDQLPSVEPLLAEYRRLEARIAVPTRAPGVIEAEVIDQPLFVRGNHHQPAEPVRRRFLEVFDGAPYDASDSGRLALAESVLASNNPLTARVEVNRLWHHVYGQGLVPTTDNFGHMGDIPSHPELLDYLAARFVDEGYSIKQMIRLLVTSDTFRQCGTTSVAAREADADNRLLSRMPARRLEAEAIRDSLLATSGELDLTQRGAPVRDDAPRRSVYVAARRNEPSALLAVFDAPVPYTTTGRRSVTNVPAQSLALMNDPFVIERAAAWSRRVLDGGAAPSMSERVVGMYNKAFARPPSRDELVTAMDYVDASRDRWQSLQQRVDTLIGKIAAQREQVAALETATRARIAESSESPPFVHAPEPIARWEFDDGLADDLGGLDGEIVGEARVEHGQLVLNGNGYVVTAPLAHDLAAKTLEAWVSLDALDQAGAGVLGVQTTNGATFDSIVFAERRPRRWMAGSNVFQRTEDFDGSDETAVGQVIHLAIVYHDDGRIACYRNGEPYGKPYEAQSPVTFAAGSSQLLLGMRHGTPGGRRGQLQGAIERALLYDRALSAEEIEASAASAGNFITHAQLLAAMSDDERAVRERLGVEIENLEAELVSIPGSAEPIDAVQRAWQDLSLALFNAKEFIYVP